MNIYISVDSYWHIPRNFLGMKLGKKKAYRRAATITAITEDESTRIQVALRKTALDDDAAWTADRQCERNTLYPKSMSDSLSILAINDLIKERGSTKVVVLAEEAAIIDELWERNGFLPLSWGGDAEYLIFQRDLLHPMIAATPSMTFKQLCEDREVPFYMNPDKNGHYSLLDKEVMVMSMKEWSTTDKGWSKDRVSDMRKNYNLLVDKFSV